MKKTLLILFFLLLVPRILFGMTIDTVQTNALTINPLISSTFLVTDGDGKVVASGYDQDSFQSLNTILTALTSLSWSSGNPIVRMNGAASFVLDTTAYVPDTVTVNGHALSSSITLSMDDIADGTTYKRSHNDFTDVYKSAVDTNTAKTSFPGFGTTAGTALEGNTVIPSLTKSNIETALGYALNDSGTGVTDLWSANKIQTAIGAGGSFTYPGAGIPVSTGSAWGTSITDNHTNWDTAYTNAGQVADATHNGYLSYTDWNTFNDKVSFPGFTSLFADYGITLGAVATSNSYNDLDNKPTLGSAAAQDTSAFDPAGSASTAQSNAESYADGLASNYAPALGANDNYVTDAEKIVIGNTSGMNSGDNAINTTYDANSDGKVDVAASADACTGNAVTVTNGVYTGDAGTVFLAPNGSATNLTNFPTLNQDTTGSSGSVKSPATTGVIEFTGPGAGEARVKTVRDANDTLLELGGDYTPTGTWDFTSLTGTWPTFNQNTTGTAANGWQGDSTLSTDHSYYVDRIETVTAGESITFGNILYHKISDDKWYKDSAATYQIGEAIALADASADASLAIARRGKIRDDSWSWTVDDSKKILYASDATAGAIIEDVPTTTGHYAQLLGTINSATTIFFNPSIILIQIP